MARAPEEAIDADSRVPDGRDLPVDADVDLRDERAHPDRDPFARGSAVRRRYWDVLAVVALGGGLGSLARYLLAQALPTPPGGFPWATFLTNVIGCFALGALMVFVLEVWPPRRYLRPFLGVGVLGGFTTFSTYTVEIHALLADRHWLAADAYALDSLVGGLFAVWLGIVAARLAAGIPLHRRERTAR